MNNHSRTHGCVNLNTYKNNIKQILHIPLFIMSVSGSNVHHYLKSTGENFLINTSTPINYFDKIILDSLLNTKYTVKEYEYISKSGEDDIYTLGVATVNDIISSIMYHNTNTTNLNEDNVKLEILKSIIKLNNTKLYIFKSIKIMGKNLKLRDSDIAFSKNIIKCPIKYINKNGELINIDDEDTLNKYSYDLDNMIVVLNDYTYYNNAGVYNNIFNEDYINALGNENIDILDNIDVNNLYLYKFMDLNKNNNDINIIVVLRYIVDTILHYNKFIVSSDYTLDINKFIENLNIDTIKPIDDISIYNDLLMDFYKSNIINDFKINNDDKTINILKVFC